MPIDQNNERFYSKFLNLSSESSDAEVDDAILEGTAEELRDAASYFNDPENHYKTLPVVTGQMGTIELFYHPGLKRVCFTVAYSGDYQQWQDLKKIAEIGGFPSAEEIADANVRLMNENSF